MKNRLNRRNTGLLHKSDRVWTLLEPGPPGIHETRAWARSQKETLPLGRDPLTGLGDHRLQVPDGLCPLKVFIASYKAEI
jgi:hypothetical protein